MIATEIWLQQRSMICVVCTVHNDVTCGQKNKAKGKVTSVSGQLLGTFCTYVSILV